MAANKFSTVRVSAAKARATDIVGVDGLKKEKEQTIKSFVNGRDVFVALPTGPASLFVTRRCLWYSTSSEGTHTVWSCSVCHR